jgi:hypothetical protein
MASGWSAIRRLSWRRTVSTKFPINGVLSNLPCLTASGREFTDNETSQALPKLEVSFSHV